MVPDTTYIDGVDQTGFLLADNGQSNRYSRIYTYNQYFAMVRLDEFKFIFTTEIQNGIFQRGDWGGPFGAAPAGLSSFVDHAFRDHARSEWDLSSRDETG